MTRRKHGNYDFVTYVGDHPPYHVHIRKDGREIGRWDIEHQKKMDEFRLTREIMDGLRVLGYLCTI